MKGWGWIILIIIVGNAIINRDPLAIGLTCVLVGIVVIGLVCAATDTKEQKQDNAEPNQDVARGWCNKLGAYCEDAGEKCERGEGWCRKPASKETMVAGVRPSKKKVSEPSAVLADIRLGPNEWVGVAEVVKRHEEHKRSAEATLEKVDKMDGREFETWCALLLRQSGYTEVETTVATGDQGVDITAKKNSTKYAIQCKRYSSDLGNHPVQEVYAGMALYGCKVGVVMTNKGFTSGAEELAKATGVKLWGRWMLYKMLLRIERQADEQAAG